MAFASHLRGLEKNPRADHGADNDGSGGPRAQAAHQVESLPVPSLRQIFRQSTSLLDASHAAWGVGVKRLTTEPTRKVTLAPIRKYHVKATLVNHHTDKMTASPANMPASAPRELAARSRVPKRNRPSKLPKGKDTTVKPASRSWFHRTNPKAISTNPQNSVMRRDKRKNVAGSVDFPHSREKSMTLEAAKELSDPAALDMATAMMDASSKPARPGGISRTRKSGKIRSTRSPGARSGACCAKTKSSTPISKNTANWIRTITPLARSARPLSRSLRAASSRCTMV